MDDRTGFKRQTITSLELPENWSRIVAIQVEMIHFYKQSFDEEGDSTTLLFA
jgi:hypothetical protein